MRTLSLLALTALASCSAAPRTGPAPTPHTAPDVIAAPHGDAAPEAPPPMETGRLPPLARPTRYALSLALDPRREDYRGEVRIDVDVPSATQAVVLHARGLTIATATVRVGERAIPATTRTRRAVGGREDDEELALTVREPIPAGAARIELAFTGRYSPDLRGLFRVHVGEDWYAFSDFEPTDARRAFPCFDEPSFKVPVEVTVTTPTGMTALANMPETAHAEDASTHDVTFRFAPTPPTPTYLVAFAAGPFEFHEGPRETVPVRVATVRGRSALGRLGAETAAAQLRVLGDYFGRPYPYPKLDLVAVPDFLPGAMENPGLITFRDTALLVDAERAPSSARNYVYGILAHELAHQWFGNLVTMAWWNDLWLNEGFASWMGNRVMRTWRPELGAEVERVESSGGVRSLDGMETARPIRTTVTTTSQAMEVFDAFTYGKGEALLGMLEAHIGEERFRDGIRAYLQAHAWGNATSDDLLTALTAAGGDTVAPIATSFLDRAGVPLLDVALDCAPGRVASLTLRQSRFTNGRPAGDAQRWAVPVRLRYGLGATRRARTVLLTEAEQHEALDLPAGQCPAWVFPNAGAYGYYWYALTPATLRATLDGAQLTEVEKLDLLADLDALYEAGNLPVDAWLDALARLVGDGSASVAERVAAHIGSLDASLVTDASREGFRRWVTRLVGARARALGFTARPGDSDATRTLRRTALLALGMYTDDAWVHQQAADFARRYLADPTSVPGDTAAVALPIASRHADAARFDALRQALDRAPTPQDRAMLLGAMLTFDDLAIVRRAYDLSLTDTIHMQDLRVLYGRSGPSAAHRALLLDWAREHVDAVRTHLGRQARALVGGLARRCDAEDIQTGERFLRELLAGAEGVERGIAQSAEGAGRCVRVRARDATGAAAVFGRPGPRMAAARR